MVVAAQEAPVAPIAPVVALLDAQTLQDQPIPAESVEPRPRLRRLVMGLGWRPIRHSQRVDGPLLLAVVRLRLLVVVLSVVVELLYGPHHLAQRLLGLALLRRCEHRPLFAMRLALGAAMAFGSQVLSFTVISHIPDLLRRLVLARGALVAEDHVRLVRARLGHVHIIALMGGRLVAWGPVAHHLVGVCRRVGTLIC